MMDKETREYRRSQFEKNLTFNGEYLPKIKIVDDGGQTNWLSISNEELHKITDYLVREDKRRM